MAGRSFFKDPDALLDYHINWTNWLAGDVLATSLWDTPAPAQIELVMTGMTPTHSTIWLRGGTVGDQVEVTNHILTQEGRAEDRTIRLLLTNR